VSEPSPTETASVAAVTLASTEEKPAPRRTRRRHPRRPRRHDEVETQNGAGWLFVLPVVIILGLFLFLPVIAAMWVSVSNWSGKGSPVHADFVGFDNYRKLLTTSGLAQRDLATSVRNNMYYVLLVVPLQTIVALGLALVLNARRLKGKGFFRTAFYFPSVTSTVAIITVFLFLFTASGSINTMLEWFGIHGPRWFSDSRGVLHQLLSGIGVLDPKHPPGWMTGHRFLGITFYEWLAGPSVAMCALIFLAVWTTGGTFMLLFLAALQDIPDDLLEAASVDGASSAQAFRKVTLPLLRPTMFLVITLGLIGTWQVFDQVQLGTKGGPSKTTITPAYLSYDTSFTGGKWGQGAAISFILFGIIIVMNIIQRIIMRERRPKSARHQRRVIFDSR